MKISDYAILTGPAQLLPRSIMQMVDKGWEPLGGISATFTRNGDLMHSQAMICRAPIVIETETTPSAS